MKMAHFFYILLFINGIASNAMEHSDSEINLMLKEYPQELDEKEFYAGMVGLADDLVGILETSREEEINNIMKRDDLSITDASQQYIKTIAYWRNFKADYNKKLQEVKNQNNS